MSIMACHRDGCGNVMCDRHSDEHGYICDECFNELVLLGVQTNISEFMESRKIENQESHSRAYFDAVFPDADGD